MNHDLRKPIIAGNWKMNTDMNSAVELVEGVLKELNGHSAEIIFAPPFPFLSVVQEKVMGKRGVFVSAQDCHQEVSGAFTGEVSAAMIKSVGVSYVIIGHSERRQIFHEDGTLLKQKLATARANGLIPIYCVGETYQEREAGEHMRIVERQLKESLFELDPLDASAFVVAYEPVWAIGTGKTASPEDAQQMHAYIRGKLSEWTGSTKNARILYGGSVKPGNAAELFAQPDIDGGLVGGASLNVHSFLEIIEAAENQ
jgi:triosephosphate isomerase